jgi:hypothetical protein
MIWRPKNWWLVLAALVAVIAWQLTRTITHVDRSRRSVVTIAFDERPPFQFERLPLNVPTFQEARHRFPELALTSEAHVLFLVTAATHSITIRGVKPSELACRSLDEEQGGPLEFLLNAEKDVMLAPIAIQTLRDDTFIPIPTRVRNALAHMPDRRAGIACTFLRPLATAPTFTERAATVRVDAGPGGAVLLDVSALEDVDNLRFSGGLQVPLGGDRTRLVYGRDDVVEAEWTDVTAQEQRDIVLVIIGALSAIAAALVIEAIRPTVENRTAR